MKTITATAFRHGTVNLDRAIQEKMDEFLDVYSLYLKTRIAWIHDEARLKAYELRLMDPSMHLRC